MRATFGIAALELGNTVDKLMILTGDVSTSAGLDRFKKKFPEKYLDVGIAEQNLIGIAAGLASEDFNVITNIRRADVREEMGWVVLELTGHSEEIEKSLDWVRSLGVRIDPVGGDVVEG